MEVVVYVALLAVLSVLVMNALFSMTSVFVKAKTLRRLTLDGETAIERITREARLASAVDDAASALATNFSRLSLDTVRSSTDPTPANKDFYVSQGRVLFQQDGGAPDFLTSPVASTTALRMTKITTARSEAVKIELTLEAGSGANQIIRSFYNTVILRGSY